MYFLSSDLLRKGGAEEREYVKKEEKREKC
jgi:hypothetical protein